MKSDTVLIEDVADEGGTGKRTSWCSNKYVGMFALSFTLIAVAGGIALYFFVFNTSDASNKIDVKFSFDKLSLSGVGSTFGSGSNAARRQLEDDVVAQGQFSDVSLDEYSIAIDTIEFCKGEAFTTYNNTGEQYDLNAGMNVNVTVVTVDVSLTGCEVIYKSSDDFVFNGGSPIDICEHATSIADEYVNFVDEAAVTETFSLTASVSSGTYTWARIRLQPMIRISASVQLSNGTFSGDIYTKACGPATCGSRCYDQPFCQNNENRYCDTNIRDCAGLISDPKENNDTGIGTFVHPITEDIWDVSVFDNPVIPQSNRYWRRCDHDMKVGPADSVYVTPRGQNKVDELLVKFTKPFILDESDETDTLEVKLGYDIAGSVSGNVKPMVEFDARNLSHVNYYQITDGMYSIKVSSLSLAPVIFNQTEEGLFKLYYKVRVRVSNEPVCYTSETDFTTETSQINGQCYSCQLIPDTACYHYDTLVGDKVFNMEGMQVHQEFDILVTLYFVGNKFSGLPDFEDPRAATVAAHYPELGDCTDNSADECFSKVLPFDSMRVETIETYTDNEDNIRYNFLGRQGRGLFPRIRHFPLILNEQSTGFAHVEVSQAPIVMENQNANCTCNEDCICYSANAYFEGTVSFIDVQTPEGWKFDQSNGQCDPEDVFKWSDLPVLYTLPAEENVQEITDSFFQVNGGSNNKTLYTVLGGFRARGYMYAGIDGEQHARWYGMIATSFLDPNYVYYNSSSGSFTPGGCYENLPNENDLCLMTREYLDDFANMNNFVVPLEEGAPDFVVTSILKYPTTEGDYEFRYFTHAAQLEVIGVLGGCVQIEYVHLGSLSSELRQAIQDVGGTLPEDMILQAGDQITELLPEDYQGNITLPALTPIGTGQLSCNPEPELGIDNVTNASLYYKPTFRENSGPLALHCWIQMEPDYFWQYPGNSGTASIYDRLNTTLALTMQKILDNSIVDNSVWVHNPIQQYFEPWLKFAQTEINSYASDDIPWSTGDYDKIYGGGGTYSETSIPLGFDTSHHNKYFVIYKINKNVTLYNSSLYTDPDSELIMEYINITDPKIVRYGEMLGPIPPQGPFHNGSMVIHWRTRYFQSDVTNLDEYQGFSYRMFQNKMVAEFGSMEDSRIAAEASMPPIPGSNPSCDGITSECYSHSNEAGKKFSAGF